jgi:hypothetical protein
MVVASVTTIFTENNPYLAVPLIFTFILMSTF